MTTSGQFLFNPSNAEILIEAFSRCGKSAEELTRTHMFEGRRSLNLELVSWSNRGVNLWAVDLQTIPILAGQGVYVGDAEGVPPSTVAVLDCYFSQVNGQGPGVNNDRIMLPMSRDDYAEYPNKLQQGIPTRYWFERTVPCQIVIWQTPTTGQDSTTPNTPYVISYYRLRRLQDANPQAGQTADVEYRFLDALCAGMAKRLSVKFAPDRYPMLVTEAKAAWDEAAEQNRDDAPFQYQPDIGRYYAGM